MGSKLVKILVIILLIIVVLGVGVVAGYKFLAKGSTSKPKPPTAAELASEQYALQQITTNLQGGAMIQVTITLQADSGKAKDELDQRKAQVLDTIEGILHNTTQVDLEKSDGMIRLKQKIMQSINTYMQDGRVTDVFYANPIIQ
jgi:flagellar FliL protein